MLYNNKLNKNIERHILESPKIKNFIKNTYDLHCQCQDQCVYQNEYLVIQKNICSRILATINPLIKNYIQNTISLFKEVRLIYEKNNSIYLYNNQLLSWDNIKDIQNENIKKVLWMFRKGIVDNLIKTILYDFKETVKWKNDNIFVYSVGSTTLSSDYDITIYAPTVFTVKIIKLFTQYIKNKFYIGSNILFDTNVYGKGFITFKLEDGIHEEIICNNNKFYYIKESSIYQESQIMWALLKYIKDLHIYDTLHKKNNITQSIIEFLLKKFHNKNYINFLEIAMKLNKDLASLIPSQLLTDASGLYINILDKEEDHLSPIKSFYNHTDLINLPSIDESLLLKQTDFISLVNYFGTETYYSRGAFLDVVVNNQMCKNEISKINLNDYDYIQSILENAGFYIIHGYTTKYFIRVSMAFEKLSNDIKKNILITPNNILHELEVTNYYDNKLTSIQELKCRKYIIKFIYKVLKSFFEKYYKDNTKEIYIPFKNYDLTKITNKNTD